MELNSFRAVQGPLRDRYKRDAKSAFLTLRAQGTLDSATVTCKVETGRGLSTAGIHPKCGGSGLELCSGDMLLEALVACAGVSLKAAATLLDIPVKNALVSAEGDVDLRGTLGVDEDVPVGFKEIRLNFELEADASKEQREELLKLVERYCMIYHTLNSSPKFRVRIEDAR